MYLDCKNGAIMWLASKSTILSKNYASMHNQLRSTRSDGDLNLQISREPDSWDSVRMFSAFNDNVYLTGLSSHRLRGLS